MYMLCHAQTKALQGNDTQASYELELRQKSFLEEHILKWAPLYFTNVKNEAQTPLYHDGAMMALDFILSDYEYLNKN